MEDELWFAYLDQVAEQEKKAAAEPEKPEKPASPSPFACEELPSE
jgi:hypothetical protein